MMRRGRSDDVRCRRRFRLGKTVSRTAPRPLPFAYTLLVHRAAYLSCILLLFGLVATWSGRLR